MVVCVFLQPPDSAHAFKVLYSFTGGSDGEYPASVIKDSAGNFYGTTAGGGSGNCQPYGCGMVFKIGPDGTEAVLYSFTGGSDGDNPRGGLIRDKAGNLYGTTVFGGTAGAGTVFKVAPDGTEKVLHSFMGGTDGIYPYGGVIRDTEGSLYGTTEQGGTGHSGCTDGEGSGTIFKVTPDGKEKVLHSFTGSPDGCLPFGQLIMDSAGNLYGTTGWGGLSDCPPVYCGTVFKLAPDGTETVLHSFGEQDGQIPYSKLIMDAPGNLYGTTFYGGSKGAGAVFKVAPDGTETVLYDFCSKSNCRDGIAPYAGLFQDSAGKLYGTTVYGGRTNCAGGYGCGTVFELSPDGDQNVLHFFSGGSDGNGPFGDLIKDNAGHLYGTADVGGIEGCGDLGDGCGTFFRLDK